jgi:hypothetical protein
MTVPTTTVPTTTVPTATKVCPVCQCENMVRLGSLNMKICPDCKTELRWTVEHGQSPIFGGSVPTEANKNE